jgi:hypothetical protein
LTVDKSSARVAVTRGPEDKKTKESPLLESVVRERLVKTQQTGKGLAGAVMIGEVWKSAIALQVLVVPSWVYKWSINLFTNQYPVYSHPPPPNRDRSKGPKIKGAK